MVLSIGSLSRFSRLARTAKTSLASGVCNLTSDTRLVVSGVELYQIYSKELLKCTDGSYFVVPINFFKTGVSRSNSTPAIKP